MSDAAENELLEQLCRRWGISTTLYRMLKATPNSLMRDLMADARRGIPTSASMLPPQPSAAAARGTGVG
jgi:hypothetical protein